MHRTISEILPCKFGKSVNIIESPYKDSCFNIKDVRYLYQSNGEIINMKIGKPVSDELAIELHELLDDRCE